MAMTFSSEQVVIAFDLYGTLLSTESIANGLSSHFGPDNAAKLAALWRRYQLEYTWRLNSMKQYTAFSEITALSFDHALNEVGLVLGNEDTHELLDTYHALSTFQDVSPALKKLKELEWIKPVVFSNGNSDMIKKSVSQSPELSPFATIFHKLVSVEDVKRFKPDPEVYYHLAEQVGKTKQEMESIWLVSGNPFDIVGANAVGMKTAWINRTGNKWVDKAVVGPRDFPSMEVRNLVEFVEERERVDCPS